MGMLDPASAKCEFPTRGKTSAYHDGIGANSLIPKNLPLNSFVSRICKITANSPHPKFLRIKILRFAVKKNVVCTLRGAGAPPAKDARQHIPF